MPVSVPRISVVIPAHDEEGGIGRCLRALVDGAPAGGVEVVVVCNGCSDRTAAIAAAFGSPVRVVEIPVASKPAALNAGDQHSTSFPRFYVDADVEVSLAALQRLAAAMGASGALAGSVRPELDLSRSSRLVRSYYRVWSALPQIRSGLTGAGVYGLSAAGRERFDAFPDLVGDDAFVNSLFAGPERLRLGTAFSVVRPARTIGELVRTRVRVHLGNAQVARSAPAGRPGLGEGGPSAAPGWIEAARRQPALVADLPVYLAVNGWSKVVARRRLGTGAAGWARAARGK